MPSKSPAQARLMAGVAHNPKFASKVGIPMKVGKEFNHADAGSGILKKAKSFPKAAPKQGPLKLNAGMPTAPISPPFKPTNPSNDSRKGRITPLNTDRGAFRWKANRKGE